MTDLVTGINALTADVSARLVETSSGAYRVVVEGPQGSDNALTITDSVFGLQTTNVLEVDTYTLGAAVATEVVRHLPMKALLTHRPLLRAQQIQLSSLPLR